MCVVRIPLNKPIVLMNEKKNQKEKVSILQAAFVGEDVSNIIKDSIDLVLQNQQYSHDKVNYLDPGLCCSQLYQSHIK